MEDAANNEESIESLIARRKQENEAFQKILNAIRIKEQLNLENPLREKQRRAKKKDG